MILTADHDRVRLITFNRPEALNAFNDALYSAAADAIAGAVADDGVAVIVLTGAGRGYSAGADLKEMQELNTARADDPATGRGSAFPRFVDTLTGCPKPVIAAVNGVAVGIGFTMLAHCDLVLAAESARFRTPFTALGVAPEAASSYLFPVRMGMQQAAWVLYSSEWFSAEEMVGHGMVWRVCTDGALIDDALAVATALAVHPLPSLMATKRLLVEPRRAAVDHARDLENMAFAELLGQPANADALRAFTQR